MSPAAVRRVVDVWAEQTTELGAALPLGPGLREPGRDDGRLEPAPARPDLGRHGAAASRRPARTQNQRRHLARTGRRLLLDYVAQESGGPRVVVENDDWLVVVPFWAAWPFETLVIPRRPAARLPDLDPIAARRRSAARSIELLGRYDGLFRRPFPYSMGWHQAPFGGGDDTTHWQLHAHFYPPLLRGDRPQVHGRLRAPRRDAARPDRRGGRRAAARRGRAVEVRDARDGVDRRLGDDGADGWRRRDAAARSGLFSAADPARGSAGPALTTTSRTR